MYLVLTQPGVHTTASTNATIWEAFSKGTSKRCAQLLLTRPLSELSETDSFGYNLLHRACLKRDATVVAALLQSGIDPDSKTTCGVTAVHLAASVGQTTILHMLFQYGATLDQKENRGRTALHYAAENDHVISFAWLLQYPQSGSLNSADQDGVTPLHLACCAVKSQVLHYLLRNGQTESKRLTWNPLVIDRFGNTCLHAPLVCISTASSSNSQSLEAERRVMNVIWSILTAPSSSLTQPPPIVLCQSRNREGLTPLDVAKRHGLSIALIWLLTVSQLFTSKSSECTARTLLILTYSIVWILVLFFPLTASIVTFSLSDYFEQGWICFVAACAFLWFSLKQRHRMNDGTNRPNPFFAGTLIAGFFTTLFCYVWDLFPWDHSLSNGYRQACVWFLLTLPPLVFVLFINLAFADPGVALRVDHLNAFSDPALLDYVERESSLVWAGLSSDTELAVPHTSSRTQSFSSYCPFCKVAIMSALQIKHCKMCNRCVRAMDHHCLFLLNCIARLNHRRFIVFILLCVVYAGCFSLLCFYTVFIHCFPNDSEFFLDTCSCIYSKYSRCTVMFFFNILSFLWGLNLLKEQLIAVSLNTSTWQRARHSFWSTATNFRHWKALLRFLTQGHSRRTFPYVV